MDNVHLPVRPSATNVLSTLNCLYRRNEINTTWEESLGVEVQSACLTFPGQGQSHTLSLCMSFKISCLHCILCANGEKLKVLGHNEMVCKYALTDIFYLAIISKLLTIMTIWLSCTRMLSSFQFAGQDGCMIQN
jgi:hypothetical protein